MIFSAPLNIESTFEICNVSMYGGVVPPQNKARKCPSGVGISPVFIDTMSRDVGGSLVFVVAVNICRGAFGAEMDTSTILKCGDEALTLAIRFTDLHYIFRSIYFL